MTRTSADIPQALVVALANASSRSPPGDKKQIIAACSQGFSVCTADSRRTAGDQRSGLCATIVLSRGKEVPVSIFDWAALPPVVISCILTITHSGQPLFPDRQSWTSTD